MFFCNDRCNQENLIEQLKNGLNAMRMPVGDLVEDQQLRTAEGEAGVHDRAASGALQRPGRV